MAKLSQNFTGLRAAPPRAPRERSAAVLGGGGSAQERQREGSFWRAHQTFSRQPGEAGNGVLGWLDALESCDRLIAVQDQDRLPGSDLLEVCTEPVLNFRDGGFLHLAMLAIGFQTVNGMPVAAVAATGAVPGPTGRTWSKVGRLGTNVPGNRSVPRPFALFLPSPATGERM
jgi:hypothetical protein